MAIVVSYRCRQCKIELEYVHDNDNIESHAKCTKCGSIADLVGFCREPAPAPPAASPKSITIDFRVKGRRGVFRGKFVGYEVNTRTVFVEMGGKYKGQRYKFKVMEEIILCSYTFEKQFSKISSKEGKQYRWWNKLFGKLKKLSGGITGENKDNKKEWTTNFQTKVKPVLTFYQSKR